MSVEIRSARREDEARCLEMVSALTGESASPGWSVTFQALLSRARGEILVADEAGLILGVATVSCNLAIRYAGEYAQLEELIVDPAARGKNVGGLLVEAAVEKARQRGCVEFGLYLMPETEKNRGFYEKYGFEFIGSEMRQRL
ncbi:MAG: GNAT family N-acetyltransferase [Myxococcota bacterium]|nr:hypothetical protein [Phycisphaerae bacterium]